MVVRYDYHLNNFQVKKRGEGDCVWWGKYPGDSYGAHENFFGDSKENYVRVENFLHHFLYQGDAFHLNYFELLEKKNTSKSEHITEKDTISWA